MKKKIQFKCKCCNRYVEMEKNVPGGFLDWAYPGMEWSDFEGKVPSLMEEHWIHSDKIPKDGENRIVKVRSPFAEKIGNEFYMEFLPALAYFNGYDNSEQISDSAIVKCRFEKIILSDEYSAWICVKVLKVFLLCELSSIFSPWQVNCELENYAGINKCDKVELMDISWESKFWTGQGDIGESKLIYIDDNGIRHLVLLAYYDFHNYIIFFGNIVEEK